MALIKCPECGKEISDQAPACIHCGYPLAPVVPDTKEPEKANHSRSDPPPTLLGQVEPSRLTFRQAALAVIIGGVLLGLCALLMSRV